MIEKLRREVNVMWSEARAVLKRETTDIIALGDLLLEIREQIAHGQWLPLLKSELGLGRSSAQNYMNAARFAAKYPTVGNLKLQPTVLYWLGGGTIPLDEIDAIFKAAETEWVDLERADEIGELLRAERMGDTEEELEREEEPVAAAAHSETEDILAGPPPDLSPAPEPAPINIPLQEFDEAVGTLFRLNTKPRHSFASTTHGLKVFNTVAEFMGVVADQLKRSEGQAADAKIEYSSLTTLTGEDAA
jgi:hypothetical protein